MRAITSRDIPIVGWRDGAEVTFPTHGAVGLTWQTYVDHHDLVIGVAHQQPNHDNPWHYHPPPEMFYVLQGDGKTCVGGHENDNTNSDASWHDIHVGDVVCTPPESPHRTIAGPEGLVVLWMFPIGKFETIPYRFFHTPKSCEGTVPSLHVPSVHSVGSEFFSHPNPGLNHSMEIKRFRFTSTATQCQFDVKSTEVCAIYISGDKTASVKIECSGGTDEHFSCCAESLFLVPPTTSTSCVCCSEACNNSTSNNDMETEIVVCKMMRHF